MSEQIAELNLLEKTELRIHGLELSGVNLNELAARVAQVLELPANQVLVIDVREDHVCLDLLTPKINIRQIAGREQAVLKALTLMDGLTVGENARIESSGILGLIAYDQNEALEIAALSQKMGSEIESNILRRALVFATGFEVKKEMIEDTNSPFLIDLLQKQGYAAEFGGILDDDLDIIANKLMEATERGFGLVITTGGVGAEDKDFSVEAMNRIDRQAATPWIVKYEQGTGRHVKAGVRIGVGQYGLTTLINLPGPHEEVMVTAPVLQAHCNKGLINKELLANELVQVLRAKLSIKKKHWDHHK